MPVARLEVSSAGGGSVGQLAGDSSQAAGLPLVALNEEEERVEFTCLAFDGKFHWTSNHKPKPPLGTN